MRLGRRAQRGSAVVLTAMAMVVAYFGLIHWWLVAPLQHIWEEEQALRSAYKRYAPLQAQRSVIQARLEETRQRPFPDGSFLAAGTAEAATAQLMQLVSSRTAPKTESGLDCSIKNRLPQSAEEAGEVLKIRVDVELECGIESLAKTLYRMETEPPFLKVDALSVQRIRPLSGSRPGQSQLAVRLQVSGYLRKTEVAARG